MQDRIYIHYGHATFDPKLFKPIQNEQRWIKPRGGLWASPIDAKLGWKDWCEREEFRECSEENSFRFTLPEANIFVIDSVEKLKKLPTIFDPVWGMGTLIDFEKCIEFGYDAVELNLSADHRLYWELYGWDCDSILIMNPNKIKIENITQVTAKNDILLSRKKHSILRRKKKGETIMKKNTSTILGIVLAVGGAAIEVAKILLDCKSDIKVKDSSK